MFFLINRLEIVKINKDWSSAHCVLIAVLFTANNGNLFNIMNAKS